MSLRYLQTKTASRVYSLALVAVLFVTGVRPGIGQILHRKPPPPPLANQRVLWLGDSITQAGDYVTFVQYGLDRQYPDARFDMVSIGLSSETASCLSERSHPFPRPCVHERLQRALTLVKPTVVIACYGMNDGIYAPQSPQRMAAFQQGILKLSDAIHAAGARLILLTPPPFDATSAHNLVAADAPDFGFASAFRGYDGVLTDYALCEDSLTAKTASRILDLHTSMEVYLAEQRTTRPNFAFAGKDGIHPDLAGHLFMARVILRGLGVTSSSHALLGDELAAIQADPLYALVKRQREARSAGWLSYVGYTREKTVKTDSIGQVEQENAALQSEIDSLRRTRKPQ